MRKETITFVMCLHVRLSPWYKSAPKGKDFHENISIFFEKSVEKIQASIKYEKKTAIIHYYPRTYHDLSFSAS